MTTHHDALDRHARQAHAASLESLSPRVEAQLAQRRRAALAGPAPAARTRRSWIGAALATVCVLVLALQLRAPVDTVVDAPRTVASAQEGAPDPVGMLAEDPDFYLWLASGEAQAYAVE
ncbi:MAG: hypothetical protein ACOY37_01335 [Pseudomonadota bacterium]